LNGFSARGGCKYELYSPKYILKYHRSLDMWVENLYNPKALKQIQELNLVEIKSE